MKTTWSKIALALGFIASTSALNVAQAQSLVGYTNDNRIGVFSSTNVAAATFVEIQGLAGDSFIGIDLRPLNNTIYGITTGNNLYTVDAYTGETNFVTALSANIINSSLGYGIDFNPVADFNLATSLRLVSSAGDNYAINVVTGAVTVATSITNGSYSAVAYTNSTPAGRPAGTELYYVDASDNTLNKNVAPGTFNAPNIQEVGKLGNIGAINGFEIFADRSAFLAATVGDGNGATQLFNVDLDTGKANQIGLFSTGIRGLAAAPSAVPVPAAAWLFGSALIGFAGFRRKSV